ncbi:MAG: hypothetical protein O3A47_05040 [Chloroflexi bacterium]|nr:hypothetical protein [Chloroflexota bacterium]
MLKLLTLALAVTIASGRAHGEPTWLLADGCAGSVCLRMEVDKLLRAFPSEQTRLVDLQLEGHFAPAIEVFLDSSRTPSITAEIFTVSQGWNIRRMRVHDPRFRTSSGVGVGSSFGELSGTHEIGWSGLGEGDAVATVPSLGMSFILDQNASRAAARGAPLPAGAKVVGILVVR